MNGSTLVIGAGTNLGGRWSILRAARDLLAARFGVTGVRVAPVWETPPMGPPQPDYLNTAFAIEHRGTLGEALELCRRVERALGRERRERWGPRTLDLDLLWHASLHCRTDALTVPHEGLRSRTFALDPLLALVPDAVDPTDDVSLAAVRAGLPPSAPPSPLGDGFTTRPKDRADRLAAAAEAMVVRTTDRGPDAPLLASPLDVPWEDDHDDAARLAAWLEVVRRHVDDRRFALRRVAVLEDSARLTRAVLLGEDRRQR